MANPIISLVVILLSIASIFFYVMPAYDLNVARRGDIESLTKILSTSGEIKTLIDRTKTNLQSIDPLVLSRFEVFLPEKIDPIRFANNLQSIASKNRIILSDLKVESPNDAAKKTLATGGLNGAAQGLVNTVSLGAKINQADEILAGGTQASSGGTSGKKYVTTKATLSFTTTYETFQLFLNDLEKSLGVINITNLSFSPMSTDASDSKKTKTVASSLYQFSLSLETYSLK